MAKPTIMAQAAARVAPASAAKPPTNYADSFNRAIGGTSPAATRQYERGQASADYQQQWADTQGMRDYQVGAQQRELGNQQAIAGIGAQAQLGAAQAQAGAQKFGASQSAGADRYRAQLELEGAKVSADASKFGASQSAKASMFGSSQAAGAQRYVADVGLKSDLAGYGSQERITGMQQSGETQRTGMSIMGQLIANREDNFTNRRGQDMNYLGTIAQSQWRAPNVQDVRYWN